MAERLVRVAWLALFAIAILIALLPVSVGNSTVSVACNSTTVARADNLSQTGGIGYEPALLVWIDPGSVVPSGDTNAAQDSAVCGSAAQNHMIPALILAGLALLLFLFGDRLVHYIRTGELPTPEPKQPPSQPSPPAAPRREAPGHFDPTQHSAPAGADLIRTTVRLSCQHLDEMIGDPSTMVGKAMLCRTCGRQTVESVVS